MSEEQPSRNVVEGQPLNKWQRGSFLASWMSRRQSVGDRISSETDGVEPNKQRRIIKAWSKMFDVMDVPSQHQVVPEKLALLTTEVTRPQELDPISSEAIAPVSDEFMGELVVDHSDDILPSESSKELASNILEQALETSNFEPVIVNAPARANFDPDINDIHEALGYQLKLDKNLFYEPEAEVPVVKRAVNRPVDALEVNDAKESDLELIHETKGSVAASNPTHVGAILASRPVAKVVNAPTVPVGDDTYFQTSEKLNEGSVNHALYNIPVPQASSFFTAAWPVRPPVITQLPAMPYAVPTPAEPQYASGELYRRAVRYGVIAGALIFLLILLIGLIKR